MNFFLQGDSGIGKSYLLQEVLTEYSPVLAGFTVQRLYQGDDFMGFRACVFNGQFEGQKGEFQPGQAGIFISPDGRDLSVLEDAVLQVEISCKQRSCRIVLLDEIGGIELISDRFMKSIHSILNSGKFCVGVLKSRSNLNRTLKNHGTDEDYLTRHGQLIQKITDDGQLYNMTDKNRDELRLELQRQLKLHL